MVTPWAPRESEPSVNRTAANHVGSIYGTKKALTFRPGCGSGIDPIYPSSNSGYADSCKINYLPYFLSPFLLNSPFSKRKDKKGKPLQANKST
ncbi:hypothetical protein SLEP1_g59058 [Rubroshorea leprosula]|uniref:Uncharacterized protein n=1 Tax=Rubroshorea leprosula TaxID=152421 RepID=A0AAV5MVT2_9ROSI|nr:hypothetical protein SLEP1_g59058 [Rubroshorea leprosula]